MAVPLSWNLLPQLNSKRPCPSCNQCRFPSKMCRNKLSSNSPVILCKCLINCDSRGWFKTQDTGAGLRTCAAPRPSCQAPHIQAASEERRCRAPHKTKANWLAQHTRGAAQGCCLNHSKHLALPTPPGDLNGHNSQGTSLPL